jgi:predicted regulator of Ras-like GTPase activity (Roadblock/LC7/MglB family)
MLSRLFGHKSRGKPNAPALEQALRAVAHEMPGLRYAAVVSADGLVQAMVDPFGKANADRASAMAAAALSLGGRISGELQHGQMAYTAIVGKDGTFIVYLIGEGYALALDLPAETEVGAAIEALAQVADTLRSALYPGTW